MTTTINSNGSKWYGQEPDTIEDLLQALEKYPLDRRFEAYGNFIMREPEMVDGSRMTGLTRFWGNFYTASHVFCIDTDEPEVIEKLTKAIRANQQRPDYLSQPVPKRLGDEKPEPAVDRNKAVLDLIWRHTHPDYKGVIGGARYILVNRGAEGTCSVALESLTDDEIADKYKYAKSREARGQRAYG